MGQVEAAEARASAALSRRAILRASVAGAVGVAAWHTPVLHIQDLHGSRAAAAASGPLTQTVVATSFDRTQFGRTFQHWGNGTISSTYPVPFPSGSVDIIVRGRATGSNPAGTNANGRWLLAVGTVPAGCSSCEVTGIVLTGGVGSTSISGVPGSGPGNLRYNNSPPPAVTAVTAEFTVTCT